MSNNNINLSQNSLTNDEEDNVPRVAVIALEVIHECLWRHIEDTLLLPLRQSEYTNHMVQ